MRLIDADALTEKLKKQRDKMMESQNIGWEFEYNGICAAILLVGIEETKTDKWIPIWEDDPNTFPPVDREGYSDYILLSFSNYSGLIIGQYRVDEDSGAFYAGDEEEPLTVHDVYVNAWQPLPSPYSEEVEEE